MSLIEEERQKLLIQLEESKHQIKEDMNDIKQSLNPITMLRNVIHDTRTGFKDNRVAADSLRMVAAVLPKSMRYRPVVYASLNYVLPYIIRNYPKFYESFTNVKLPELKKSSMLLLLKNGVTNLRRRIHTAQYHDQEVQHIGSFTSGSPY